MLLDEGLRGGVVDAIDRLPDREKLLMSLYYEQGLNLREIGAVREVERQRGREPQPQARRTEVNRSPDRSEGRSPVLPTRVSR